ncbi:MAG TPA: hypothetical protein VGD74_11890, partial [Vulgatibacter sp.]
LRQTMQKAKPVTRRELVEAMLQVKDLPGPMGPASVTESRDIRHPLYLLFIDMGTIREVDPDAPDGGL